MANQISVGKVFRNQALRDAFFLWYVRGTDRRIIYYFMPNGACYFNEVWGEDNYKAISVKQLFKLSKTAEQKQAVKAANDHWQEILEDLIDNLGTSSKNWWKVKQLKATIEANKTLFKELYLPISPENKLQNILDFYECKKLVTEARKRGDEAIILCSHYSINVQSKFEDGEQLQWDLEELEEFLEEQVEVSDFDDLIIYFTKTEE